MFSCNILMVMQDTRLLDYHLNEIILQTPRACVKSFRHFSAGETGAARCQPDTAAGCDFFSLQICPLQKTSPVHASAIIFLLVLRNRSTAVRSALHNCSFAALQGKYAWTCVLVCSTMIFHKYCGCLIYAV